VYFILVRFQAFWPLALVLTLVTLVKLFCMNGSFVLLHARPKVKDSRTLIAQVFDAFMRRLDMNIQI